MALKNKHVRFGTDSLVARATDLFRDSDPRPSHPRKRTRRFALLIHLSLVGLLLGWGIGNVLAQTGSNPELRDRFGASARPENTLVIWAGDKAHVAPDFLAVIDFDEQSSTYGKVLRTVPLTGRSAIGNEPHHVGLSADGKTLAVGGLLSILRGQDQVFFFDVTHPRDPQFIRSDNPPGASIADEFDSLSNDGFLATFMGSPDGATRDAWWNMTLTSISCRRGRSIPQRMASTHTASRLTKLTT